MNTGAYSDYDKFGNWQKRTTFRNNIPKEVTLKRIEYYRFIKRNKKIWVFGVFFKIKTMSLCY